jgi:hypothetical protein
MQKFVRAVFASMLVAGALVPATAVAAGNELRGAPSLHRVDAHHARLRFATDQRLTIARGTPTGVRVAFAGGQRVSSMVATGRHGDDYLYTARVSSQSELRPGVKYTVRFRFAGQPTTVRLVKLHQR